MGGEDDDSERVKNDRSKASRVDLSAIGASRLPDQGESDSSSISDDARKRRGRSKSKNVVDDLSEISSVLWDSSLNSSGVKSKPNSNDSPRGAPRHTESKAKEREMPRKS